MYGSLFCFCWRVHSDLWLKKCIVTFRTPCIFKVVFFFLIHNLPTVKRYRELNDWLKKIEMSKSVIFCLLFKIMPSISLISRCYFQRDKILWHFHIFQAYDHPDITYAFNMKACYFKGCWSPKIFLKYQFESIAFLKSLNN